MIQDKMVIKGKVSYTRFSHTEAGLEALKTLKGAFSRGEMTKEHYEELRQQILENPEYSKVTQKGENNNIVTNEGDALIADLMSQTPARTKVDNTNGHIEVGTGFISEVKTATSCTTPTGSPEVMDATYPKLKGSWGATDDNVTQYRSTFEAGDLNAAGIDEAALINNAVAVSGDCLAYAELLPNVTVAVTDTLQVDWELTFVGA